MTDRTHASAITGPGAARWHCRNSAVIGRSNQDTLAVSIKGVTRPTGIMDLTVCRAHRRTCCCANISCMAGNASGIRTTDHSAVVRRRMTDSTGISCCRRRVMMDLAHGISG